MSSRQDRVSMLRRHLLLRSERLPRLAARRNFATLLHEIDQIRRICSNHDISCITMLCYQIEKMIAAGWSDAMAAHYFAALDDAIVGCVSEDGARQAVLASVAIRKAA